MKKKLKTIYYFFYNFILDSHLHAKGTPFFSLKTKLYITWRHRIASWFGILLNDNEFKIQKLKNKHKNERCFIIGNGPSLNKTDLTKLKNEVTFGVNAIYTNFDKMGYLPSYYVVEDVFVAEDRRTEINNMKGPIKLFGNYLRYCFDESPDTLWLNVRFRYDEYENFPNFSTNSLRQIWTGGTVSYLSLQLAYYFGFKEVYMIGFDHHYDIPASVKVSGTEILSLGDDVNHFNKEYFGKGKRWHDPMVDRMEMAYLKARKYFEKDGRKVFNATVGGSLEVFERINFEDLFT